MMTHFFPFEPISICLKAIAGDKKDESNRSFVRTLLKSCPTTLIAQDSQANDKIVGVALTGISKQLSTDGTKVDWYNTDISNEHLLQKWSEHMQYKGKLNPKLLLEEYYE